MPIRKQFNVKVYDQDGTTLIRTLSLKKSDDSSLPFQKNPVSFSARMNGGLGECVIDLFAVVTDTDARTQAVTRIYKGFVSRYEPFIEAGDEGVRVTCLGLVSLLSHSYYGTANTYAVTHTTEDPEDISQAVIDNFNGAFGGSLIGYSGSTSTVGTNVTFTFTEQTWLQALQKAHELAGAGWWWAVRADGKLWFQAKPVSATHTFTIGRDIVSLRVTRDSEKVKNEIIVERSGGTRVAYTDATSQATYGTGGPATGRRTLLIKDSSIANATTQDQRGNKALGDGKDGKNSTSLVVNSKYGQGIESILVGQTCKIRNFAGAPTFLSDNMQIVGLSYAGETVTLELEEHAASFGQELAAFVG
jgi:hypothetical protein